MLPIDYSDLCGTMPQELCKKWRKTESCILHYASSMPDNKIISEILSYYNDDNQNEGKVQLHIFCLYLRSCAFTH